MTIPRVEDFPRKTLTNSARSRRRHRSTVALVAATLVLSACAGGDSEEGDGVTLVFRQQDPGAEATGVEEMVELWNEQNPDIQVELQQASWDDAMEQFIREVQAQEGPDVMQVGFVWTSSLAEMLVPLDDYVAQDPPGEGIEDFVGVDLQTVDGQLYGLPWTVDTGTLAYNADLLEETGISDFPGTWEEFQQTAATLSGDGTDGYCFNAGDVWFQFNAYLWSNGETLLSGEGGQARVAIDEAALAEAIAYFQEFFDGGATPSSYAAVSEYGDPTMLNALGRGDCAMSFLPIAPFRNVVDENPETPLVSAPMPEGSEGVTSFLGGRALAVSSASEHPDEAYRFAAWMTEQQLFEEHGYPWWPAQTSLIEAMEFPAEEEGFQELLPQARTFAEYVETGLPVNGINNIVSQELSGVFSGRATPEDAAAAIVAELEGQLQ